MLFTGAVLLFLVYTMAGWCPIEPIHSFGWRSRWPSGLSPFNPNIDLELLCWRWRTDHLVIYSGDLFWFHSSIILLPSICIQIVTFHWHDFINCGRRPFDDSVLFWFGWIIPFRLRSLLVHWILPILPLPLLWLFGCWFHLIGPRFVVRWWRCLHSQRFHSSPSGQSNADSFLYEPVVGPIVNHSVYYYFIHKLLYWVNSFSGVYSFIVVLFALLFARLRAVQMTHSILLGIVTAFIRCFYSVGGLKIFMDGKDSTVASVRVAFYCTCIHFRWKGSISTLDGRGYFIHFWWTTASMGSIWIWFGCISTITV